MCFAWRGAYAKEAWHAAIRCVFLLGLPGPTDRDGGFPRSPTADDVRGSQF